LFYRHTGKYPAGAGASRPAVVSKVDLERRREARESRLRPWLANGTAGNPSQQAPVDHSKAVSSRVQDSRIRRQARKDQLAETLARTQASRTTTRTQVNNKPAPAKVSYLQARSQASRQTARPQATTTRTVPEKASTKVGPSTDASKSTARVQMKARHVAKADGGVVLASEASKPKTVVRHTQPQPKPVKPEPLPVRTERLPSSKSSALPSGGLAYKKIRRGVDVAAAAPAVSVPKGRTEHVAPVDDSTLPAGVYVKVRREGSDGPAFTLRKVDSAKYKGEWTRYFSPLRSALVLSPEPEETEVGPPLWSSLAPTYSKLGTTPLAQDLVRPRKRGRPIARPLRASPPDDRTIYWPSRLESRPQGAGSVANGGPDDCSQGKRESSWEKSSKAYLRQWSGYVDPQEEANRKAADIRRRVAHLPPGQQRAILWRLGYL
jgi:hypothetical protein